MKLKFMAGSDVLPAFFQKDCSSILAAPLAHIFNRSLQTCAYPDKWKSSKICPIHKKFVKLFTQHFPYYLAPFIFSSFCVHLVFITNFFWYCCVKYIQSKKKFFRQIFLSLIIVFRVSNLYIFH